MAVPLAIGSTVVVQQEIVALGPPPTIQETGLRDLLDAAGLEQIDAHATLVLGGNRELPANR